MLFDVKIKNNSKADFANIFQDKKNKSKWKQKNDKFSEINPCALVYLR